MTSIDLTYLHDAEERKTDYATGGQKGVKPTQIGALDPVSLVVLGRVAGIGAMKYAAFNFLRGYDWAFSYNAAQRHLNLFWAGEDTDVCTVHGPQDHPYVFGEPTHDGPCDHGVPCKGNCDGTNLPHPALAAWHGLTLTSFLLRGIVTDDRPPRLSNGQVTVTEMTEDDKSAWLEAFFAKTGPSGTTEDGQSGTTEDEPEKFYCVGLTGCTGHTEPDPCPRP